MTESFNRKLGRLAQNVSGTGTITSNAATATAWQNARTITLDGDLSGNVSIDGTSNVTLTATVANNTVALGTDTTGNYVATIAAGSGITVTGSGSETAAVTVAIDNTVATLSGEQTLTNKTISGSTNTLSNIANGSLTNSTISGVSLGGTLNSLTMGTGVALNSGTTYDGSAAKTISIGQAVGTTDNVTFAGVTADNVRIGVTAAGEIDTSSGNLTLDSTGGTTVMDDDVNVTGNLLVDGNLTVSGTTVTVNATNLAVEDNMIYLNSGSVVANPDLGLAGNYNDGTYRHAGIFRDASDGVWKFFHQYVPEPDASAYIDITHGSFALAPIQASTVTATTFTGTLSGAAPAGSLSGSTLASGVTASSLTSVGTLTSLTVSGTTLLSQTSGNTGIGITNPSAYSADANTLVVGKTSGDAGMTIRSGNTNSGLIYFADTDSGSGEYAGFIGYTHNTNTMFWGTNETTKMTLDSSGNFAVDTNTLYVDATNNRVGIGTSSPTSTFSVSTDSANTQVTIGNNTTYDQFIYFRGNNDWSMGMDYSNSNAFVISNTSFLGTNDRIVLTTGGNLGLGVTPNAKLHVDGGTVSADTYFQRISWTDSGGTRKGFLGFYSNTGADYRGFIGADNAGTMYLGAVGNGGIQFKGNGPTSTTQMTLDADGDLGIGATTVNSGIEVVRPYSVDTVGAASKWTARFRDSSAAAAGVGGGVMFQGFKSAAGAIGNFGGIAGLKENATDNNEAGYVAIYTTPAATGILNERLRITSLGNVGIGTTSPQSALHLIGNMIMGDTTYSRPALTSTNWGYSASYRVLMIGSASTSYATQHTGSVTVAFNYNPASNANGSFNGDGREILFRRGTKFVTPNSADTSFYLNQLVLYDGNVGLGTDVPARKLHVMENSLFTNAGTDGGQSYVGDAPLVMITTDGNGNASANYASNALFRVGIGGASTGNITTEWFRVNLNGRVGIGSTNPSYRLDATTHTSRISGVITQVIDKSGTENTSFNVFKVACAIYGVAAIYVDVISLNAPTAAHSYQIYQAYIGRSYDGYRSSAQQIARLGTTGGAGELYISSTSRSSNELTFTATVTNNGTGTTADARFIVKVIFYGGDGTITAL